MKEEIEKLLSQWAEIDYLLNSEGVCISKEDLASLDELQKQIGLTINGINLMPIQIIQNYSLTN